MIRFYLSDIAKSSLVYRPKYLEDERSVFQDVIYLFLYRVILTGRDWGDFEFEIDANYLVKVYDKDVLIREYDCLEETRHFYFEELTPEFFMDEFKSARHLIEYFLRG